MSILNLIADGWQNSESESETKQLLWYWACILGEPKCVQFHVQCRAGRVLESRELQFLTQYKAFMQPRGWTAETLCTEIYI